VEHGLRHLACFTLKDKATAKKTYSLTLTPEPSAQFGVPSGAPPGAASGVGGRSYLCYKLKCAQRTANTVTVTDQFGSRPVTGKVPNMLCAPAQVASPSGAFLDASPLF